MKSKEPGKPGEKAGAKSEKTGRKSDNTGMKSMPASILVDIVEMLLDPLEHTHQAIADAINERYKGTEGFRPITREGVTRALREARKRRYLFVRALIHETLSRQIADAYGRDPRQIQVVDVRGPAAHDQVALATAELLVSLILELGAKKNRVHLGIGGGPTVRKVIERLTDLLTRELRLPALAVHALVPGFEVRDPSSAPVTFFGEFEKVGTDIQYFNLLGSAVVSRKDAKRSAKVGPLKESFDARTHVDIVLTSLGDEHGQGRRLADQKSRSRKPGRSAVGDICGLLYDLEGPIDPGSATEAGTLFKLPDLVRLAAKPDKFVVIPVAPCANCRRPKGEALRPLLEQRSLACWTHVITDLDTAQQVLAPGRPSPPVGRRACSEKSAGAGGHDSSSSGGRA